MNDTKEELNSPDSPVLLAAVSEPILSDPEQTPTPPEEEISCSGDMKTSGHDNSSHDDSSHDIIPNETVGQTSCPEPVQQIVSEEPRDHIPPTFCSQPFGEPLFPSEQFVSPSSSSSSDHVPDDMVDQVSDHMTDQVSDNITPCCSAFSTRVSGLVNSDTIRGLVSGKVTMSHLLRTYSRLVKTDPHMYRGLESLLASLSYIATNSVPIEIIELLYMSSNLLRYLNDRILATKPPPREHLEADRDRLEQMLQVLQCVEVFVELSARRLGGSPLKWLVVAVLAAVKVSIRLCLVYQHNRVLVGSFHVEDTPKGWVGPRSGIFFKQSHPNSTIPHHIPNKDLILAELCYTLRPIIHLATLGLFKSKSWIPYTLALSLDVFSLRSLQRLEHPTDRQETELSRRKIALLLYLLRSPFYNEITEHRLTPFLNSVSRIPIVGLFTNGLADYLPDWQKIYSYIWCS